MLAPHHAEDSKFGDSRLAAEQPQDLLVLVGRDLMLGDGFRSDGRHHPTKTGAPTEAASDWKTPSPSVDPSSGSEARSGCGIMPITLPSRFTMPAMSSIDPLGL